MAHIRYYIAIPIVFCACAFAIDWKYLGFNGRVKSCETKSYTPSILENNSTYKCTSMLRWEFRDDGKLLSYTVWSPLSKLKKTYSCSFYQSSNVTTTIDYDEEGIPKSYLISAYNCSNKCTGWSQLNENKQLVQKCDIEYDNNQHEVGGKNYNIQNVLTGSNCYIYDTDGNQIEVIYYNHEGNITYKKINHYNTNKQIIESYEPSKKAKTFFQYDSFGNAIEKKTIYTMDNSVLNIISNIYNKQNLLVAGISYDFSESVSFAANTTIENNARSPQIRIESNMYNSDGKKIASYECDSFYSYKNIYLYDYMNNILTNERYLIHTNNRIESLKISGKDISQYEYFY